MKFYFKKSIFELKKKNLMFYIFQLIFICLYIFLTNSKLIAFNQDDYIALLGLKGIKYISTMDILIKLLSYSIIIYFVFKTYTNSMLKIIKCISLRISSRKWIIYEMLVLMLFIAIMRLIYCSTIYIAFSLLKANLDILSFISIAFKDILFYIALALNLCFIINIYSYNKGLLISIPILITIFTLFLPVYNISNLILILVSLVLTFVNCITFKPSLFCNFWS